MPAVVLDEHALAPVVAVGADVGVHGVPHGPPAVERRGQSGGLGEPHRPVGGDPAHHLGVDEVPPSAAHLPQALVRFAPVLFEVVHQRAQQGPDVPFHRDAGQQCQVQGVDDLAVHVELELPGGGVAEPDRARAEVAGQPVGLRLGDDALAGHPVEGLEVAGVAGDGAQQPLAPGGGLLAEAAAQQRGERHRGVAQPAEPVVPVARAADVLGQ